MTGDACVHRRDVDAIMLAHMCMCIGCVAKLNYIIIVPNFGRQRKIIPTTSEN